MEKILKFLEREIQLAEKERSEKISVKKYRIILISIFLIIAFGCGLIWQIYFDLPDAPDSLTLDLFSISHIAIFIVMFVFFDSFFDRKKVIWFLAIGGILFEIIEFLLGHYIPITRILTWETLNNAIMDIPCNLLGIYLGYLLILSKEKKN